MSTFLPAEKGTTIRMPSTANLMLDSADRDARYANPFDFQITRPQALLNGFFTRIATSEVVLEWNIPNGYFMSQLGSLAIDISGVGTYTIPNPFVASSWYSVEAAITALVADMNAVVGAGAFTAQPLANGYGIANTAGDLWSFTALWPLALKFGFLAPLVKTDIHAIATPDFRPYRYLDFVSPQLTYNQDLKDSSTSLVARDVLCRWYFAWDTPPALDAYGYPILMGYTAFTARRLYNPPKQIRWDNIQSLGNLSFQVYGSDNNVVAVTEGVANWLMTLQVSEV